VKANPAHQIVLLDIADIDRRILQADHARTHPVQGSGSTSSPRSGRGSCAS
jgi:hypothetical protein